jgi:hypothetical protein
MKRHADQIRIDGTGNDGESAKTSKRLAQPRPASSPRTLKLSGILYDLRYPVPPKRLSHLFAALD